MSRKIGVRTALLTGLLTIGLSTTAIAQTSAPATGLGQSWPNATDVSKSPNFHVYVFKLHGVKYVQVNDLNGTVHAAVAVVAGNTILPLPIGVDAQNVTTTSSADTSASTTVYSDSTTSVSATTTSSGTLKVEAVALETCSPSNPPDCNEPSP